MNKWIPKKRQTERLGDFRELRCKQCNARITVTNLPDIVSFCDDGCLTSYIIDEEHGEHIDTKEEVLDSIAYHQQRDEQ